jgi:WD40 repeat protein
MAAGKIVPEPTIDIKILLKHTCQPDSMASFDRFLLGYLGIHDHFPFHLMSRLPQQPVDAGFLDSGSRYYVLLPHAFQTFVISENRPEVESSFESDSPLLASSAHPTRSTLFAVCTSSDLILLDTAAPDCASRIGVGNLISCGWVADGVRVLCLSSPAEFVLVTVAGEKLYRCALPSHSRIPRLSVHPSELCAVVCDGRSLVYIFLGQPCGWRVGTLPREPISSAFLPDGLFGAAFGYDDGSIDLVSFDSCEVVVRQELGDLPVTSVAFCPNWQGAMAFASGADVCFATLPQWGFGHFAISKRYQQHLKPVKIVRWRGGDDAMVILSVDDDCMLHIFDVPQEFVPLYQPTPA